MIVPPNVPARKFVLFVLAILLLALGGIALVFGANLPGIRSLGALACILSAVCVRKSNLSVRLLAGNTTTNQEDPPAVKRPGKAIWIISIVLLPVLGISFVFLYNDAATGYHQTWPVYLFAGLGLVCTLCWSYLVSQLV